jgi:RHS repeat-associated protein
VGGSLEIVCSALPCLPTGSATDYRHYVYAGGRAVAALSRKSTGTNTWSYVLSDHQNSVYSLVNSSGTSLVNESYTPFGARRNPTTWSGVASTSDLTTTAAITREGYTFQTALGLWMGLNHMNGRVQDSVTGRFLSADPHIPGRTNTQDFNRYAYVVNNPLSYIDPTGFCPLDDGSDDGQLCEVVVSASTNAYQNINSDWYLPLSSYGTPVLQDVPLPEIPEPTLPTLPTPEGDMETVTVTARDPYSQCLADALAAIGVANPADGSETLENVSQARTALEGAVEGLAGASAVNVGRAFGPGPGPAAATNAALAEFGEQTQGVLESAGPLLKGTGYVLGAISIANGYQTGGLLGAAYATSDFALESVMSTTVLGAGAAIAFNRMGGTRAVLQSPSMAMIMCSGLGGI